MRYEIWRYHKIWQSACSSTAKSSSVMVLHAITKTAHQLAKATCLQALHGQQVCMVSMTVM